MIFIFMSYLLNDNCTLVLIHPGSLNLSFHNLSIYQFSRKNTSLNQFIPIIYNKIIIKILGYFQGVTQIVALRLPNMGLKVSSGSSLVMLCFGYCYSVLAIS